MLHYSHARFAVQVEQSYSYCFVANYAVQYSLLVFEIVFYNPCNITDGAYKGWVGGIGGGAGGQAEGGPSSLLGHRRWCCALSRQQGCTQTTG